MRVRVIESEKLQSGKMESRASTSDAIGKLQPSRPQWPQTQAAGLGAGKLAMGSYNLKGCNPMPPDGAGKVRIWYGRRQPPDSQLTKWFCRERPGTMGLGGPSGHC